MPDCIYSEYHGYIPKPAEGCLPAAAQDGVEGCLVASLLGEKPIPAKPSAKLPAHREEFWDH